MANKIIEKECYSAEDIMVLYGIGLPSARALMKSGSIPVVRYGERTLVPIRALQSYEDELGRLAARDFYKANKEHFLAEVAASQGEA